MIGELVELAFNWPGSILTILVVLIVGIHLGENWPPPNDNWPGPPGFGQ